MKKLSHYGILTLSTSVAAKDAISVSKGVDSVRLLYAWFGKEDFEFLLSKLLGSYVLASMNSGEWSFVSRTLRVTHDPAMWPLSYQESGPWKN